MLGADNHNRRVKTASRRTFHITPANKAVGANYKVRKRKNKYISKTTTDFN